MYRCCAWTFHSWWLWPARAADPSTRGGAARVLDEAVRCGSRGRACRVPPPPRRHVARRQSLGEGRKERRSSRVPVDFERERGAVVVLPARVLRAVLRGESRGRSSAATTPLGALRSAGRKDVFELTAATTAGTVAAASQFCGDVLSAARRDNLCRCCPRPHMLDDRHVTVDGRRRGIRSGRRQSAARALASTDQVLKLGVFSQRAATTDHASFERAEGLRRGKALPPAARPRVAHRMETHES